MKICTDPLFSLESPLIEEYFLYCGISKPWLFRIADLLLLPISLVLAWGLWRAMFWAVVAWLAAVVLFQDVPFLLFGEFFASDPGEQRMHYGQVVFHAIMLGILLLLLPRKKGS